MLAASISRRSDVSMLLDWDNWLAVARTCVQLTATHIVMASFNFCGSGGDGGGDRRAWAKRAAHISGGDRAGDVRTAMGCDQGPRRRTSRSRAPRKAATKG